MRSVKFLVAAGAAALLSSVAFAADMPIMQSPMYAPAPVDDFGGWYLRGDIGFSNQRVKKLDWFSYPTLLSLNQNTGFDTAGIFGIGVGYQFNNWFRADVTGQYRGKSNFHGSDVFVFNNAGVATAGVDTYTASKSEWLALANAYVDLGTWWSVTPFIGAGVGFSRNTISSYVDTNTPALGVATAPTASKWNFAWALHTGLAYRVNPGFTVELGYSYVNLGDATTGIVSDFTGFANNHTMGFKDITSHDLTLGVRWNLDSPAVYAPPPVPVYASQHPHRTL
jgi:opacity protein-like surface antigen